MILKKLAEAFWKQDWIAVLLEVLIVVVGIFRSSLDKRPLPTH